ncbi:MAG: 23S rRNA (guanosine(2251)-2'-O)-methyltransferase RlmB, partial [Erysipelotrichaceae bacterium]|nr:23S rRNA (guanosine(2251)-2'-O)-methyltransferase RlmB [Erysipelotrichaceae bacterium]
VVGTSLKAQRDYRSVDYDMPLVLVIGSEGEGMRRLVEENCDILVKMPLENGMDSLNASAAAVVMLYRIYDSRFPVT